MPYKIESKHKLTSDFLPKDAFTRTYSDQSAAVATAIEGVDDPKEQEVCVVCTLTGNVVWRSTEEEYE